MCMLNGDINCLDLIKSRKPLVQDLSRFLSSFFSVCIISIYVNFLCNIARVTINKFLIAKPVSNISFRDVGHLITIIYTFSFNK